VSSCFVGRVLGDRLPCLHVPLYFERTRARNDLGVSLTVNAVTCITSCAWLII
jgi:hypothetical protein